MYQKYAQYNFFDNDVVDLSWDVVNEEDKDKDFGEGKRKSQSCYSVERQ